MKRDFLFYLMAYKGQINVTIIRYFKKVEWWSQ